MGHLYIVTDTTSYIRVPHLLLALLGGGSTTTIITQYKHSVHYIIFFTEPRALVASICACCNLH